LAQEAICGSRSGGHRSVMTGTLFLCPVGRELQVRAPGGTNETFSARATNRLATTLVSICRERASQTAIARAKDMRPIAAMANQGAGRAVEMDLHTFVRPVPLSVEELQAVTALSRAQTAQGLRAGCVTSSLPAAPHPAGCATGGQTTALEECRAEKTPAASLHPACGKCFATTGICSSDATASPHVVQDLLGECGVQQTLSDLLGDLEGEMTSTPHRAEFLQGLASTGSLRYDLRTTAVGLGGLCKPQAKENADLGDLVESLPRWPHMDSTGSYPWSSTQGIWLSPRPNLGAAPGRNAMSAQTSARACGLQEIPVSSGLPSASGTQDLQRMVGTCVAGLSAGTRVGALSLFSGRCSREPEKVAAVDAPRRGDPFAEFSPF